MELINGRICNSSALYDEDADEFLTEYNFNDKYSYPYYIGESYYDQPANWLTKTKIIDNARKQATQAAERIAIHKQKLNRNR